MTAASDDRPPFVPGSASAREPGLAHPVLRALAFALDGIGTVILTTIVVFVGLSADFEFTFEASLVVPLLSATLSTVLTAIYGVTPMKAVFGIRVVDAVTGSALGWRAIPRSLIIVAPIALTFLVYGVAAALPPGLWTDVGWFYALVLGPPIAGWTALLVVLSVRPRHRGLQDLAGRSVVVLRR